MTVKGLVVFVRGSELIEMSHKSVEYHTARISELEKKIEEMRRLLSEAREHLEASGYSGKVSNSYGVKDPVEDLQASLNIHTHRKRNHEFLAAHYNGEATYELSLNDLSIYGYETRGW